MKRILNPVIYLLAAAYFLVDVIFMAVARPVADWIAGHWAFTRLRRWIKSLRPYAALTLFAIPVILLEPIKPVAAYLVATGHALSGILLLIAGELLKLVLVERLFCLTRDRLLSIPAFAWLYGKYRAAKAWLESSEAWRTVRRLSKAAALSVRVYFAEMRFSRAARRIDWQSR